MSKINLSKIGFFNPGRLSDREVELGFIARQGEFKSLLDAVLSYEPGEVPQHYVLIGQRGMGKTTLLVRLAVELKKSPHKKRFLPLQYPEEQYNIDRLPKFWLNSLDALADTLDLEGKKDLSRELDTEIKKLSRAEPQEIYPIFQHWVKKLGRCPVLMVDNLNLIFDKISTEDQHRLRAILMSEGAPILIGASASTIKQTVEYGEPFYDAFQIKYLKKLSLDESIEVLKNLARITDKPLHAAFSKNRGRIATFHQLTGGTPRTLSMLFPLVSDGFSEEIQTDLDAILDIITPLYIARFEELSDQMQVILDAIALHWDPISLEDTRNITQLSNAKLSPQLKRLMDVGWIQKSNPGKGKGALYEISERFFNVWYLMRRSSRRQKRELYCLSRFLEVFYGDSLESVAGNRLAQKNISVNDAYLNLALAEATNKEETKSALQAMSYKTILDHSQTNPDILNELDIPKEQIFAEIEKQCAMALEHLEAGHFDKALQITEALLKTEHSSVALYSLHAYSLAENGRLSEAEATFKRATQIDEKSAVPWIGFGNIYQNHLNKFDKAEKAYNRAIQLDENHAYPWYELGNLYQNHLNRFDESEIAYKKATQLDAHFAHPWGGLGNLYQDHLNRFEDAEMAFKEAIQIDKNLASQWSNLGNLYQLHLNKFEEAEMAYKEAIQLDETNINPWIGLGNLYQDRLNRFIEAEKAFLKALELENTSSAAIYNLIFLYHDKLDDKKKAKNMLSSIMEESKVLDTHLLLEAIFAYQEQNAGIAWKKLVQALEFIGGTFPSTTQNDWWRAATTAVKLGQGQHFTEVLEETGHDIILRPYYEAIKALMAKNSEVYFTTVAAEVREPAAKILEFMKRYIP